MMVRLTGNLSVTEAPLHSFTAADTRCSNWWHSHHGGFLWNCHHFTPPLDSQSLDLGLYVASSVNCGAWEKLWNWCSGDRQVGRQASWVV